MDAARELELIALGVLLGNGALIKELTPGWAWEGGQRENSLYAELASKECGPSMEAWLARHGVTVWTGERASRRIVEVVRQQHAAKRRERLARELATMTSLRMSGAEIAAKAKELHELCEATNERAIPNAAGIANHAALQSKVTEPVPRVPERPKSGTTRTASSRAEPAHRSGASHQGSVTRPIKGNEP